MQRKYGPPDTLQLSKGTAVLIGGEGGVGGLVKTLPLNLFLGQRLLTV